MESNNLNLNIKIPDIKKNLTITISSSSKFLDLKKNRRTLRCTSAYLEISIKRKKIKI